MRFLGAPWTMQAYAQIVGAVKDGTDPIVASHGVDFFAYLAGHPDAAEAFHDAMAAGARLQALMIEGSLDMTGVRAVLDVGGSTGPLIAQLLSTYPELTGAVLDLARRAGRRARDVRRGRDRRSGRVRRRRLLRVGAGGLRRAPAHRGAPRLERRRRRAHPAELRGRAAEPAAASSSSTPSCVPGARNSFAQSTDALMLAFTPGGRERTADRVRRDLGTRRAAVHRPDDDAVVADALRPACPR